MVDQVATFLSADWKSIATKFDDFNEAKQAALRSAMKQCAADFDYPLASKDAEHENFKYFAVCLRNNVAVNPSLNSSKAVR
jgi:hypothetical protein